MFEFLAHDTNIWVVFSFVLFVVVAYKLGGKAVTGGLDARIAEIKREIDTAESLRVEAQELLAQYQRKQRDAEKEAADIVAGAQKQVAKIREAAEADITEMADRREAQLTDRLKRIEDKAMADIQNHAAAMAVEAAKQIIAQSMDEKTSASLTKTAIGDLTKALN